MHRIDIERLDYDSGKSTYEFFRGLVPTLPLWWHLTTDEQYLWDTVSHTMSLLVINTIKQNEDERQ